MLSLDGNLIIKRRIIKSSILTLLVALYLFTIGALGRTSLDFIAPTIGISLMLLFFGFAATRKRGFTLTRSQWLFVLSLAGFIGVLWLDFLLRSADEYRLVLAVTYQFGAFLFVTIMSYRLSERLVYGILAASILLVVTGFFFGGSLSEFRLGTLYGKAVNQLAIYLALSFGITIWIAVSFWSHRHWTENLFLLILAPSLFFAVLLTESRQAFLLAIGWATILSTLSKLRWRTKGALAVCIICLVLLFSITLELNIFVRLQRLLTFFQEGKINSARSISLRLEMIHYGAVEWLKNPLLGQGIRAFEKYSNFGYYSHNNYVEILYNFGIIGFVLFYIPIAITSFASLRAICRRKVERHWALLLLLLSMFWFIRDWFIVSYFRYSNWTLLMLMIYAWRSMGTSYIKPESVKV